MKLNWCDKLISALAGIILIAVGILCACEVFVPERLAFITVTLGLWESVALGALAAVLVLCGIYVFCFIFPHKPDGKFVSQSLEQGELLISTTAMEAMVRKCVNLHGDLNVTHLDLKDTRSGMIIRLCVDLVGGISIPLTADTLQRQIKQYVQECSGVSVREVIVYVSGTPLLIPGARNEFEVEMPCLPGAEGKHIDEEEKQPAHSKLFHIDNPKELYNLEQSADMAASSEAEAEKDETAQQDDAAVQNDEAIKGVSEPVSESETVTAPEEAETQAVEPDSVEASASDENAEAEKDSGEDYSEFERASDNETESGTINPDGSYDSNGITESESVEKTASDEGLEDGEEERPYEG